MTNLFIIGNGFDVQHNVQYEHPSIGTINSSLKSFAKLLERKNKTIFSLIDLELIKLQEIKSSKETKKLKVNDKLKKFDKIDNKYDRWNDLEEIYFMEAIDDNQKNEFHKILGEWIKNLDEYILYSNYEQKCNITGDELKEYNRLKKLFMNEEIYFINFNYTKTLFKIYGLSENEEYRKELERRILYAHGDADCPIFATAKRKPLSQNFGPPKINYNKPNDGIKEKIARWLKDNNINEGDNITLYVYGFSFNGTDREYLTFLLKNFTVNQIKISEFQARQIKENEENNVLVSLGECMIQDIRNKNIDIVDFDDQSLLT